MRIPSQLFGGLLAFACNVPAIAGSAQAMPPGTFRIVETSATTDGGMRYVADAGDGSTVCSFEIVIGKSKSTRDGLFGFARGAILRRPHTDCSAFLKALGAQLGFRGKLPSPRPSDRIDTTVAVLGVNQSRASKDPQVAGSFSSQPRGPWTVTKLFLADGEGEVFMNLNAVDHIGEFSVKDEGYATVVITELARVLLR